MCVYLLVKVHRLQVVDVSTLDSLGCLQHGALLQNEATDLEALVHAVNLVKKCVCVCVCITCCVVCTGWTTWVGTPGAGGLESDRLSLEWTEPSTDGRERLRGKKIWSDNPTNPKREASKFSTYDKTLQNCNNSHCKTFRDKVFSFIWGETDSGDEKVRFGLLYWQRRTWLDS